MKNKKIDQLFCMQSYLSNIQSGKITTVTGQSIKGTISHKIIGKKGFGYDPIFIPQSKSITFGQMSKKKKIKIDHRYVAFKKLKKKLKFYKFIFFNFIDI